MYPKCQYSHHAYYGLQVSLFQNFGLMVIIIDFDVFVLCYFQDLCG